MVAKGLIETESISKMKIGKAAGLQKLALQQVDINEMKFDFMPVLGTTNAIFILSRRNI